MRDWIHLYTKPKYNERFINSINDHFFFVALRHVVKMKTMAQIHLLCRTDI